MLVSIERLAHCLDEAVEIVLVDCPIQSRVERADIADHVWSIEGIVAFSAREIP